MATHSHYSCLENPMDGGAWQATLHGVTKSWTRLSDFTFTLIIIIFLLQRAPLFSIYLLIFIFDCAGPLLLCGFSLVVASGGYSLAAVHRLLIAVASFVEHGLQGTWASVVSDPKLQRIGSTVVAHKLSFSMAWHAEYSRIPDTD